MGFRLFVAVLLLVLLEIYAIASRLGILLVVVGQLPAIAALMLALYTWEKEQLKKRAGLVENFRFEVLILTPQPDRRSGSLNLVIPKSLLNGNPAVLIDGTKVQPLIASDTANWYIFDTYSQSTHKITIGGQNTIPEFQIEYVPMIASVLILAIAIMMRRFQSQPYSP